MTHAFHTNLLQSCRPVWQISLLLFAFCGCSHHEEDEDHHLEHHIPAHKPESFADAAAELSRRGPVVLSGEATDDSRQQLLDIINWLPELAADSDLKRHQWEQVRDWSVELKQLATRSSESQSLSRWHEIVEKLRLLIPDSDTWSQLLTGEHENEHTPDETSASDQPHTEEVQHD